MGTALQGGALGLKEGCHPALGERRCTLWTSSLLPVTFHCLYSIHGGAGHPDNRWTLPSNWFNFRKPELFMSYLKIPFFRLNRSSLGKVTENKICRCEVQTHPRLPSVSYQGVSGLDDCGKTSESLGLTIILLNADYLIKKDHSIPVQLYLPG